MGIHTCEMRESFEENYFATHELLSTYLMFPMLTKKAYYVYNYRKFLNYQVQSSRWKIEKVAQCM